MVYILIIFLVFELIILLYSLKIRFYQKNCKISYMHENIYNTKFLVIIPAHNEELQIENAINSIKSVNYPQSLIDIILLNDVCTDRTVEIAHLKKIQVYNQYNKKNSKGGILKSFCDQNKDTICKYDYICIADADTIFDKDFFCFANREFEKGYEIVQGQIINMQYKTSMISYFMTFFHHIINSFMLYQNELGKSSILSGKGLLISPYVLEQVKWDENSLVEDISFSYEALLKGFKIYYCHQMKVKTKNPFTFSDLWIQQRRWTSGQMQIIKNFNSYTFNKNLNGVAKKFILSAYINILIFCTTLISLTNIKIYFMILLSLYFCVFLVGLIIVEDKNMKKIRALFGFPFILFYWHIIFLSSFFKPEKQWKQIKNKF